MSDKLDEFASFVESNDDSAVDLVRNKEVDINAKIESIDLYPIELIGKHDRIEMFKQIAQICPNWDIDPEYKLDDLFQNWSSEFIHAFNEVVATDVEELVKKIFGDGKKPDSNYLSRVRLIHKSILNKQNQERKQTPIYIACRIGCLKTFQWVLSCATPTHSVDLDKTDQNGSTPLHAAAFYGNEERKKEKKEEYRKICHLLIEKGADQTLRNKHGYTAKEEGVNFF